MYTSQSLGALAPTGQPSTMGGTSAKAMIRTASTGTLSGKTFGAGMKEGAGQMEMALHRELEKLMAKQKQLEQTLRNKDRVSESKFREQIKHEIFKIDKETGLPKINMSTVSLIRPEGEPTRKISEGGLLRKKVSEEAALLGNLEETLRHLDSEIIQDEKGLRDIAKHMAQIDKEREYLASLNASSQMFIDSMASEEQLGAVLKKYGEAEKDLQRAYHMTRQKHQEGMQMMIDEFDYHPAYKRGFIRKWETADGRKRENLAYKRVPEEFTGKYFTPLRDPMKSKGK